MEKFSKILKVVLAAMFVVTLGVAIYFFLNAPTSVGTMTSTESMATDIFIDLAYVFLVIAILAIIVLPIINIVGNPGSVKKTGITLGIAVVVCLIAYFVAPGTAVETSAAVTATAADFKLTDTLLYLAYFLAVAAIVAVIGGSVANIIRNR